MSLSQTQTTNVTVTADVQNNCRKIEHTFEVVCVIEFHHIQSINQSCISRVVQVIKSLQDSLEVGNNLPGINDNVRKRGLEQKCFLNADGRLTETEQISRCPAGCSRWKSTLRKVKFSHTRYRALGPELIPVYRQSARRWRKVYHAIDLAVGCRYFLPGLRLPP